MIWLPRSNLHWVCNDVDGLTGEIKVVNGKTKWRVVDNTTGRTETSGIADNPIEAVHLVKGFLLAVRDLVRYVENHGINQKQET